MSNRTRDISRFRRWAVVSFSLVPRIIPGKGRVSYGLVKFFASAAHRPFPEVRHALCSPNETHMNRFLIAMAALLTIGCASMRPEQGRDVVTSLEVDIGRDSTVGLVLHLTNSGTEPVVLEFNTAQRYDFEVRTAAGDLVWRWSDDQMFGQAIGADTLPAGASREYRERWVPGERRGSFVAIGRVVATNRAIEQRAQFEITGR